MTRRPDWEPRFAAYIASVFGQPHVYGQHDCLLHVGRAVEAVTGEDHWSAHVGKYKSARGSLGHLKRMGFDSPAALLDSLFREKPVARAGRGDIVLDDEGIPGVCMGGVALMVAMGTDRAGLGGVPRSRWARAWHV